MHRRNKSNTCLQAGNVGMDSRGTFRADRMTVRVYAYDPTSVTGRGALLATYLSAAAHGGQWNLANMHSFAADQQYYVELTASRTSGQTHTRGQGVRIYGQFEGPCGPQQAPGQP